jgi:DNA invertase Pin-like site-specific DNA recombinase
LIKARQAGKQLGKPSTIDRATVQRIIKLRNQGLGTKAIAKALDAQGIQSPMGGAWSYSTVRRVLEREGLYGPEPTCKGMATNGLDENEVQ